MNAPRTLEAIDVQILAYVKAEPGCSKAHVARAARTTRGRIDRLESMGMLEVGKHDACGATRCALRLSRWGRLNLRRAS